MTHSEYQIVIFGKEGCQKCHALNQRVDKMLKKEKYAQFSKKYIDVMTEEGLVEFCNAECINPQRIPALTVRRYDETQKTYQYITNPKAGKEDPVCGSFALHTYLGIQTDYSSNGVITPKMIDSVLQSAREA